MCPLDLFYTYFTVNISPPGNVGCDLTVVFREFAHSLLQTESLTYEFLRTLRGGVLVNKPTSLCHLIYVKGLT
jgi:hypothetical protein